MADNKFPGQDLLEVLSKLNYRLSKSGLERTKGLLDEMGDDCSFYRKSLDIFLRRDFSDLEELISEAYSLFQKIK